MKINYIEGSKCEDLTNQRFNKLTVKSLAYLKKIERKGRSPSNKAYFYCDCDCGRKNILVLGSNLKNNSVKSCGCLRIESNINKRKYNKYEFYESYIIGYTKDRKYSFYIDLEDYDKVKDYLWTKDKDGYLSSTERESRKTIKLHSLIMKPFRNEENKDKDIDHIETLNKWDNRKSNLRFATKTENMRNSKLSKNNKSGFIGVYWSKKDLSWYSQIKLPEKTLHLDHTKTKEQAIINRLNAELKYFGKDFAPQRHLFDEYGIKQSLDTPQ